MLIEKDLKLKAALKMVSIFRKLSNSKGGLDIAQADQSKRIQLATCAILMVVAGSDEFTDDERKRIIDILKDEFSLTHDDAEALMEMAEREINRSVDYWHFTNILNQSLSDIERMNIVEAIWKVIYTDGFLSAHEDMMAHKFSFLLNLTHDQMIAAKLKVKQLFGLDNMDIN